MMAEQWTTVPCFDGHYEVSNLGRVRSTDRPVLYRLRDGAAVTRVRRGRILTVDLNDSGYETVRLYLSGRRHVRPIHQLVALAFDGPGLPGQEVRHLDGNERNNRWENLRWGTRSENMHDQVRHGTHAVANRERCPQGHPLSGVNLDPARDYRSCWACHLAMSRGGGVEVADAILAQLVQGWRPGPFRNRTHCRRRHPTREPNLVPSALRRRHRSCLACQRAMVYVAMAWKRRGERFDVSQEAERYYAAILRELPDDVRAEWERERATLLSSAAS